METGFGISTWTELIVYLLLLCSSSIRVSSKNYIQMILSTYLVGDSSFCRHQDNTKNTLSCIFNKQPFPFLAVEGLFFLSWLDTV